MLHFQLDVLAAYFEQEKARGWLNRLLEWPDKDPRLVIKLAITETDIASEAEAERGRC